VQNISGQMGKPSQIIWRYGGRSKCFLNVESASNSGIAKEQG